MKSINVESLNCIELNAVQLRSEYGGASFAYRVGQALRFLVIAASDPITGGTDAVIDVIVTETQN